MRSSIDRVGIVTANSKLSKRRDPIAAGVVSLAGVESCRHGHKPDCQHCGIRDIAFCSVFDSAEIAAVQRLATTVELHAGDTLFEQGDPASYVYNIVEGRLRQYALLADGRRQITGFARPGDFLGLTLEATRTTTSEAITPTVACRFGKTELGRLSDAYPKICRRMLELKEHELEVTQGQLVALGRKSPVERVASFLWHELEANGLQYAAKPSFQLEMTRGDIADYLGLTIETVSRTFTKLRQTGTISLPRAEQVIVEDIERLRDFCES
jgi:CRP/FNR family transcriptional regulator